MGQRLQLHSLLVNILGTQDEAEELQNVHFQPPANVSMKYPAIVYAWDTSDTKFADNSPYRLTKRYTVTVIDRNPDTDIPSRVSALPMCVHDRTFVAENLNHYVFTLYF